MLPLALSGLLVSACNQEEVPDNGSRDKARGLTVSMTIAPATNGIDTKAASIAPLPGEDTFDNACMLIYKQGAGDNDLPELVRTAETNLEVFTVDDSQLYLHNGGAYEVYIIAGQPAGTISPDQSTTKGQLMRLTAGKPLGTSDSLKLLFTGKGKFTYNYVAGEGGTKVDIPLYRVVARVDIALTNLEDGRVAKVYIYDMAKDASYWSGGNVAEGDYYNVLLADAVDNTVCRAYLNENYAQPGSRKAAVYVVTTAADGSDVKSYEPAVINNGVIERNKIYELSVTLKNDALLEITSGISCDSLTVHGDIQGTYLKVSQSKITADAAAAVTTAVTCQSDGTVSIAGYVVDDTETADGSNLPDWLPRANITLTTDADGFGSTLNIVTLEKGDATEKVVVRLKTGNITKDIEIQ